MKELHVHSCCHSHVRLTDSKMNESLT